MTDSYSLLHTLIQYQILMRLFKHFFSFYITVPAGNTKFRKHRYGQGIKVRHGEMTHCNAVIVNQFKLKIYPGENVSSFFKFISKMVIKYSVTHT